MELYFLKIFSWHNLENFPARSIFLTFVFCKTLENPWCFAFYMRTLTIRVVEILNTRYSRRSDFEPFSWHMSPLVYMIRYRGPNMKSAENFKNAIENTDFVDNFGRPKNQHCGIYQKKTLIQNDVRIWIPALSISIYDC